MKIMAKGSNWIVLSVSLNNPESKNSISSSEMLPIIETTNPLNYLSSTRRFLDPT